MQHNPNLKHTLDTVIAWCSIMPAAAEYDWGDAKGNCFICRYLDKGTEWFPAYMKITAEIPGLTEAVFTMPWTFGAALARLKELRDKGPYFRRYR